jgi:hypothetical protein
MPFNRIAAINEENEFPAVVYEAMAKSPELLQFAKEIKDVSNKDLIDEMKRQHAYGPADPTAPDAKVTGRLFYNTTQKTLKIYSGASWLPVGGRYAVASGDFLTMASGYKIITGTSSSPYIYKDFDRVDYKFRIQRVGTGLTHGSTIFTLKTAFEAAGNGLTPAAAVCSAENSEKYGSARVIGAGIDNSNNRLICLSPPLGHNFLEVAGTYYLAKA